ncbi:hypothetical protein CMUST_01570 [Corynebacterium mustelae]|uniref:Uncharacterized protein n=1 Tax=Corynebacterium mustelae TaxID=571915 RepID=A0A0G3GYQ7_9CORY|nr:hypothetical protein CMUST_01570 [Corynebacterium mustelae]
MVQEWDIPKETAASMRMKSRSLGAFLLRISTDKVGVLVVESLQTTVVGAPLLRKISSSQWFSAIGLLVHSVKRLPRRGFSPGKTCWLKRAMT